MEKNGKMTTEKPKEPNTLNILKFNTETKEEARKYLMGLHTQISDGEFAGDKFTVKQCAVDHRLFIDFPDKRYIISLWDIMNMITDHRNDQGTIDMESVIKAWARAEKNHDPAADKKGIKTALEKLVKMALKEFAE